VGDITVKSFTVSRLAYIFGPGTLTVTENLDVRYPMFWQMRLVIAAGANASLTDENFSTPYTGITFYDDLVVNGNLVMEAQSFSGMKVIINGTLTQKEGNLNAFVHINPGGVLQINSPNLPVSIGRVVNKGTLNWHAGQLKSVNGPIINEGLWNISIEEETLSFEGFFQDSLVYNSGTIELAPNVVSFALTKRIVNTGTINMNGPTTLSLLALDHKGIINGPSGAVLEIIGNYHDTGTTINSGSSINVPTLKTSNSSTLTLSNGCNIAAIERFVFNVPFINKSTGIFKGQGSYTFNAGFTNEGAVAPGCSPGILSIEDNLIAPSMVEIEVEGNNTGEYDQLLVNGNMSAGAVLNVLVPEGLSLNGSIKVIQTSGSFTGTFSQVNMPPNFSLEYLADGVLLTSDGSVDVTDIGKQTDVLISPSLATTRVFVVAQAAVLEDAILELYNMHGQLVRSINWSEGNNQQELNVTDLSDGMYILKLSAFPNWKGKFVKQN